MPNQQKKFISVKLILGLMKMRASLLSLKQRETIISYRIILRPRRNLNQFQP